MDGINVVTAPRVYLVGKQKIDDEALDRFLLDEGVEGWQTDTEAAGQKLVECAGRLCYKSYAKPRPGGNAAYIGHIKEVGHGSVLEHAAYNLIITGVSRSFTHELVRHRAGFGFSQRSQRYCDESELLVVVPPLYAEEVEAARHYRKMNCRTLQEYRDMDDEASRRWGEEFEEMRLAGEDWLEGMEQARGRYARLSDYGMKKLADVTDPTLRRKRAREAARSVLPNATETQIFVTGNARAFRHFVEMRGDAAADAEIRNVALEVLKVLAADSPNIFGDYSVSDEGTISTAFRKV